MTNSEVASWAKSMAQLMGQKTVTKEDIDMLLDAHGLCVEPVEHWACK